MKKKKKRREDENGEGMKSCTKKDVVELHLCVSFSAKKNEEHNCRDSNLWPPAKNERCHGTPTPLSEAGSQTLISASQVLGLQCVPPCLAFKHEELFQKMTL
jgi:hypothetical protein